LLITGDNGVFGDPTATLYLGDGRGGFSEAGAGLTGVANGSTSIADVDGDGNQDLLITGTSESGRTTALYLGDEQGGFSEASADLTDTQGSSTSIADVNGDGNPDLLIAGDDGFRSRTTRLYLGDGKGGFTEADAGLTGANASSTSIADVDGDGNLDLLITAEDESGAPTATLYLGDGQGGFTEADAGLTGILGGSTSIADVNGNGNPDLLIAGEDKKGDPTATLYLGDGQGDFSEADAGLAGVVLNSTSIADVDGDTDLDLLVTGFSLTTRSPSAILYENLFDNPLPVELAGFEATADGDRVHLFWSTVSETSNAEFQIQRKSEGANVEKEEWEQVGRTEGSGTTTEAQSYRFTDEDLPYWTDRLKYRLKQVDTDGSTSYTDPVSVVRAVSKVKLLGIYPSPARGQATVRYAVPERQDVSLSLYNVLGQEVRTLVRGKRKGRRKRRVDLSGLSSGVYFLRLRAKNQIETQRLTVVR